jgi:hypothetical protein
MSDFKLRIIAESLSDIHFIRKLLYREPVREMKFYASQGKVSAVTVARNILVHEGGPVLLAVDSDTLDIERQREYEATALAAVEVAYARDFVTMQPLCGVFTFRPSLEVVFFEAPKALELLLGKEVDERTIEEGKARPKQLLQKLYGIKDSSWLETVIRKIDEPMQDLLRAGEQATRLREIVLSFMPESRPTPAAGV